MKTIRSALAKHKVIAISVISFFLLIVLIVIIIGGGTQDCSNGDSGGASGNWQWPFDGVKDPPQSLDGGQFGDSAASSSVRGHSFHDGFDWSFGLNGVHSGSTVKAVHDGTVTKVGYAAGLDTYVWVHSDDGYNEVYQETFSPSDVKVKQGDHVNAGDTIGTAHLNGHMHLGITKESDFGKAESKAFTNDGTWLDPVKTIEDGMKSGGSTSSKTSGSGGSGGGDWTQKGSQGYKNAQGIFDTTTKTDGFSGAGGAGAVGNAIGESGLRTDVINAYGYGGLFQWSASRFSGSGGGHVKVGDKSTYTLENELATMQSELNGAYKKVKNSVGRATDVHTATYNWFIDFEGMAGNENQYGTQRDPGAQWAYKEFGGANIKANDSLLGAAANGAAIGGAGSATEQDCDSSSTDAGSADGNIVDVAKSLLGYFHYGLVHGESNIGSVDHPNKSGVTDCSGFVWLALTKAGYKTPANMGWFTGSMAADAKGSHQWLQQIDPKDAKAGDIIICNIGNGAGSAGHTAILEEAWHGADTKIIQEGGTGGSGGVNESTVGPSFSYLFTNGETVLARPIKK